MMNLSIELWTEIEGTDFEICRNLDRSISIRVKGGESIDLESEPDNVLHIVYPEHSDKITTE